MCGCERHHSHGAPCTCNCDHDGHKMAPEDVRVVLLRDLIDQESAYDEARKARGELDEARERAIVQQEKLQATIAETRNRLGEALGLIDGAAKAMDKPSPSFRDFR